MRSLLALRASWLARLLRRCLLRKTSSVLSTYETCNKMAMSNNDTSDVLVAGERKNHVVHNVAMQPLQAEGCSQGIL